MYQQMIREALAKQGLIGVDPRHVEAWMRVEYPTLDSLSRAAFAREVVIAAGCVEASNAADNEALAVSYGLGATTVVRIAECEFCGGSGALGSMFERPCPACLPHAVAGQKIPEFDRCDECGSTGRCHASCSFSAGAR